MTIARVLVRCAVAGMITFALPPAAAAQALKPEMLAQFEQKTGLKPVEIPGTAGTYMGTTHRGYPVIFTAKAGNVWGRYAARLTMAEIGREAGGFAAYVTGQTGSIADSVVGSPLERLLSDLLGQPLTLAIVLTHGKPGAPRLDVLSDRSQIRPDDPPQRRDKLGAAAGYVYADDGEFASRVANNPALVKRLKSVRNEYIRSDGQTVSFFFAGTETEFSQMIRAHGDYFAMLNALMDDLADIADAITPAR
jgi:hypothetical protein